MANVLQLALLTSVKELSVAFNSIAGGIPIGPAGGNTLACAIMS
jgi:hypothetical protein